MPNYFYSLDEVRGMATMRGYEIRPEGVSQSKTMPHQRNEYCILHGFMTLTYYYE